jgi:UDP-hydrolysing UDP-N-acetyl-D-glucosamine 2-epimerase
MTGTRADYGHLFWLLKEIEADPELQLQLVVTGAHLSEKWGNTVDQIEHDGLPIAERVPFELNDDSPLAIADSLAQSTSGLAHAFERLQPDIVVVLGDRYEVLAAAQASLMLGIPLAHLHGGETTEGAFDEAIRHAVTKMAHLHFVAADEYAWRVRQLGERDEYIYNFGAPGLDHLTRSTLADRAELETVVDAPLGTPLLAVTYHPETLDPDEGIAGMRAMLAALGAIEDASIVFTGVNADPGHDHLSKEIHDFVIADTNRRHLVTSLGQSRYLGLLKIADAVVGNSSSGLIEAPALRVPTVNIGDRQKGRLRAASVVDCAPTSEAITDALRKALDPQFRQALPENPSLYGIGNAAVRIKDVLKQVNLDGITKKSFVNRKMS